MKTKAELAKQLEVEEFALAQAGFLKQKLESEIAEFQQRILVAKTGLSFLEKEAPIVSMSEYKTQKYNLRMYGLALKQKNSEFISIANEEKVVQGKIEALKDAMETDNIISFEEFRNAKNTG